MRTRIYTELHKAWKSAEKEIKLHPAHYILLTIILSLSLFIRVYRQNELLGFYFDQGRDALVIWDLWHKGKFFLIGPVTGLAGIFLGPFYYYLIAPFYLMGGGNPLVPAYFLGFLGTVAVLIMYVLGAKMHSRAAGLFASTLGAFSLYIFDHNRWLSNPNPILLTSVLLLWAMWEILDSKSEGESKKRGLWWILASLSIGFSLHFEAASAVFYIPMFGTFVLWLMLKGSRDTKKDKFRYLPSMKTILISGIVFLGTLSPQVLFNFRHDNILLNNFRNTFFQETGFSGVTHIVLENRIEYFSGLASDLIFPREGTFTPLFLSLVLSGLLLLLFKKKGRAILLLGLFLSVVAVGFTFFQGNESILYSYYASGYFLPYLLCVAVGFGELWKHKVGNILVVIFFILFFQINGNIIYKILMDERVDPIDINLKNQLSAIDWVLTDVENRDNFNVDVYVPPVIPHAYDYLFLWRTDRRCGNSLCGMTEEQVPLLYTLFEQNPPHPERLKAWLARQKGIGEVEESARFGGITVERRKRI